VKNVLIQGGDPLGTGAGGASYDGEPVSDEFHSRLKFRRRGLLAIASRDGKRNSIGSQFFFTLGPCDVFNGKHTIFVRSHCAQNLTRATVPRVAPRQGRVAGGESTFVLQTMGEAACGSDERPLQPARVLGFKILEEPFDDAMTPSEPAPAAVAIKPVAPAVKLGGTLSFAQDDDDDDSDDDDVLVRPGLAKVRTVHDLKAAKPKAKKANVVVDMSSSEEDDAPPAAAPALSPAPSSSIAATAEQERDAKLAARLAAFKARMNMSKPSS